MSLSRRKRRLAAFAIAAAIGGGVAAGPAAADCLYAEASYTVQGSKRYVVGPKRCVANTPWPVVDYVPLEIGDDRYAAVGVKVWSPTPVEPSPNSEAS